MEGARMADTVDAWSNDDIWLARQMVATVFSAREAQDLPIKDLFELAAMISIETRKRDAEGMP